MAMTQTSLPVNAPLPSAKVSTDHPLELIPFFRRWKPAFWRDLIYTFIMGIGFCLFFFALHAYTMESGTLIRQLRAYFIISMSISYSIHIFFMIGDALLGSWLGRRHRWWRTIYYIVVTTCGVFAGYFACVILLNPAYSWHHVFTTGVIISFAITAVLVSCALLFLFLLQEREMRTRERLAAEQRRTLESERQALKAQLRMLQAQIEPHFLYNTLANAVGLIQPAPDRARLLLERLIDYLRTTLVASRDTETLLQGEINSIQAYLELMKLRMGERLRYHIELADGVASLTVPPMLLQPIVENAISHGLEPKIEGGEISLTANIEAGYLRIMISDTGAGFATGTTKKVGGGVGLANLRERIAALYGREGSLAITENPEGGVCVTLRIPLPPSLKKANDAIYR